MPRLPARCEPAARAALEQAIIEQRARGPFVGLASLGHGADTLFHEVCAELDIPTRAVLPFGVDAFERLSIGTDPDRIARYRMLCDLLQPVVLSAAADGNYQRANEWLMNEAFADPAADVTLLALWNGAPGDGPGGAADMVALARDRGARVVVIDTNAFL